MPAETGSVLLVGAGPGAADLLTLRALRALEAAEVLLYDALAGEEIVALAPRACLRIQTGKRSGKTSMSQEAINRLMLRLAQAGKTVVRLKGGDPSVFGRSGEEAAFLRAHGVEVQIIPGVTAASAAAAQFGFPLTHRGQARRLVFATARTEAGTLAANDWAGLADREATLVLYMARDAASEAARRLIAQGRAATTPAIAIENASLPHARVARTTLAGLGAAVAGADFTGPVVLVIGEVAALAQERRPMEALLPRAPGRLTTAA